MPRDSQEFSRKEKERDCELESHSDGSRGTRIQAGKRHFGRVRFWVSKRDQWTLSRPIAHYSLLNQRCEKIFSIPKRPEPCPPWRRFHLHLFISTVCQSR